MRAWPRRLAHEQGLARCNFEPRPPRGPTRRAAPERARDSSPRRRGEEHRGLHPLHQPVPEGVPFQRAVNNIEESESSPDRTRMRQHTPAPPTIPLARMRAFDLLRLLMPGADPERTKVHLAGWNGIDDPLDLFRADTFEAWQLGQHQRNFERDLVLALIDMRADRWLFAGLFTAHGSEARQGKTREYFQYDLRRVQDCAELEGRMVVSFKRPGRASYLVAERWVDELTVAEVLPERLSIGEFPGFKAVDISKLELDVIVRRRIESWRSALSSVGGVYLISDPTAGKLYVGSAYGEGGFWQRWTNYSECGHGGNVELRALLASEGAQRCEAFRYSVLEIADVATSKDAVIVRETHWKRVLMSREHGLNSN